MNNPTREYTTYDQAYDYFNIHLFNGQLPPCLITLQRKANVKGYFSPRRFISRTNGYERTDEIALNPDTFEEHTDKEIMSILVHEMVHLWQEHFGHPGRGRYHNQEWAHKMLDVGLRPRSLDFPGSMIGQKVVHDIIVNGPFDHSADQLLASGFCLNWQSTTPPLYSRFSLSGENSVPKHVVSKLKYTCPICMLNAWAKPHARLICGICMEVMHSQR